MRALRLQCRRFTWVATLAFSGMLLMPSLSHALAFAQGGKSTQAEICTPLGTQLVAFGDADADGGGAPSTGAHLLEHCPFCATGTPALGLPPTPLVELAPPLAGADTPPRFLQAPRTLFAWTAAQPRAPPTLR